MGLLHRLIPWAYSVDEHEAYYIGLLISTHVLRNKHVLINKPTLDEQTLRESIKWQFVTFIR